MSTVTNNSSNNNNNNKEESQENEFTAASALACLAKDQAEEKKDEEENDNNDNNENDNEKSNDNNDNEEEEEEFLIPQRFTKSGRKRAVPFTIKLMKVLSDKKNAHIITWMPSGKSFNILKPKAFVADILPQHFKTAKYSSFTRKLHRWGFMRHYRGEEAGAFYHKDFQRGRLDLVEEMTCHKAEPPKSTAAMAAAVAAAAPTPSTAAETPQKVPVVVKPVAVRPAATTVPPKKVLPAIGAATPKVVSTLNMPANLVGPSVTAAAALPSMTNAANTSNPSAAAVAALESERLNAAIEREVNRRLKERINAVALSRQAFAVSALRQQQLAAMSTAHTHSHSNLTAAILLQKQADLLKNTTTASLPLGIAQLGYRALASPEGQPLPSAPPTNIQGARTA